MHLTVIVLYLIMNIHLAHGTSDLTCPDRIEVGSEAAITCVAPDTTDKHGYSTPNREVAAICELKASSCQPLGHYTAAVVNDTCSVLTIPSVRISDAGEWRCTIPPSPMLICHMVVYKTPSCTMITDEETKTISVALTGFYCSESLQFSIVTLCELFAGTVKDITDGHYNCTNMTQVRADHADVTFTCGNVERSLECEKVLYTTSTMYPLQTTSSGIATVMPYKTDPAGIVLPVILCIIVLVLVIAFIVLYKTRPGLFRPRKHPTQVSADSSYVGVGQKDLVSL
ncbi:uncharacterized protein LOC124255053 [Haliotis rubra]|uniref:uncharacterized protein LOC124255053 n=1 Tax=Haliotis rubra TaxID=36100 RepID=UPI001EE53B61|nr:uncharacterized protein LOC124255053 [Haliotis rubra]